MANWQVKLEVNVNIDDCATSEEAVERLERCVSFVEIPSIKKTKVIEVVAMGKPIQRRES